MMSAQGAVRPRSATAQAVSFANANTPQVYAPSPSLSDPAVYTPRPGLNYAHPRLPMLYGQATASRIYQSGSSADYNPFAFPNPPSRRPPDGSSYPSPSPLPLNPFSVPFPKLTFLADSGATPYTCPYCDKSFGRSDVRAKHVSTMHPDQAPVGPSASGANGGGGSHADIRARRGSTAVSGSRDGADEEEEDGDEEDDEGGRGAERPR